VIKKESNNKNLIFILIISFIIIGVFCYLLFFSNLNKVKYDISNNDANQIKSETLESIDIDGNTEDLVNKEKENYNATHIETKEEVKAIYVSAWTAGTKKYLDPLVKMIDDTELNSIVIDIKDSTGKISFPIDDPMISKYGASENRIRDIRGLLELLHSKDIYVIGRISVFQDPHLTNLRPDWAIKKLSDGKTWKDRKGLSFLDPTNEEVREYIVHLAKYSYDLGFDEINFDYIRYPSDGNMKDINYNLTEGKTRADNMEDFFKYLSVEMKKEKNIPISGDVFGLTTQSTNDMGIGQVWERAVPYFDYLCPMVYPSHYPPGHNGYKNPSMYPYEVIDTALEGALVKTKSVNQDIKKIRPWLQDFDLGATYTKDMVRAQMKASYDNGIKSWLLWDPSNRYTKEALNIEKVQ
jgi:hypothetical protein